MNIILLILFLVEDRYMMNICVDVRLLRLHVSWNLHSLLFYMQPGALGDVEVNSAFYNMSVLLWLILQSHALLLEGKPNWGLCLFVIIILVKYSVWLKNNCHYIHIYLNQELSENPDVHGVRGLRFGPVYLNQLIYFVNSFVPHSLLFHTCLICSTAEWHTVNCT